jgi:hypothetical protein
MTKIRNNPVWVIRNWDLELICNLAPAGRQGIWCFAKQKTFLANWARGEKCQDGEW